ncbi:MAG: hypothetical protein AB7E80_08885 [Hyphomicrobiaceae bacterium]
MIRPAATALAAAATLGVQLGAAAPADAEIHPGESAYEACKVRIQGRCVAENVPDARCRRQVHDTCKPLIEEAAPPVTGRIDRLY